jgi:hypothetical protein
LLSCIVITVRISPGKNVKHIESTSAAEPWQ